MRWTNSCWALLGLALLIGCPSATDDDDDTTGDDDTGDDDTSCDEITYPEAEACAPFDVAAGGTCETPIQLGFYWDGTTCTYLEGCECVGEDCDQLFEDMILCRDAFGDCTCQVCVGQGGVCVQLHSVTAEEDCVLTDPAGCVQDAATVAACAGDLWCTDECRLAACGTGGAGEGPDCPLAAETAIQCYYPYD